MPKGAKPKVLQTLKPEYDPKATRAIYMYGPYKLPPSNVSDPVIEFERSESNKFFIRQIMLLRASVLVVSSLTQIVILQEAVSNHHAKIVPSLKL
jgi:hypothetical protein